MEIIKRSDGEKYQHHKNILDDQDTYGKSSECAVCLFSIWK